MYTQVFKRYIKVYMKIYKGIKKYIKGIYKILYTRYNNIRRYNIHRYIIRSIDFKIFYKFVLFFQSIFCFLSAT